MRLQLFISCIFVSLISLSLSAQNRVNNTTTNEDIIDPAIVLPESLENDVDSLMNSWYMRKYIHIDSVCLLTSHNIEYPDSVYIKRLSHLPTIMEMPYNSVVKSYIDFYTQRRRKLVESMMGLGAFYFPLFEQELDRQGLPLELKYLPIIESALQPQATSRMGATGLWQFMMGTGKLLGMEINSLIDQRCDPIVSTRMAARYLKELYNIYQDWSLAIAAYNCGPGNVNKAIRRAGGTVDYWKIYNYLPRETRGYVPAFIAANYVMHYYNEHNICPAITEMPLVTDTIIINKPLHFKQLADMLEIPIEQIRSLNPQYKTDLIPANESKPRAVRLQSQHIYSFIDNQDSIFNYKADELIARRTTIEPSNLANTSGKKVIYHKVRSGETLSKIAYKYKVNLYTLKKWNHLSSNTIRKGSLLKIYRSVPVSQNQLAKNTEKQSASDNTKNNKTYHLVTAGETLNSIANKYNITIGQIREWNNISGNTVPKGAKLRIAAPKKVEDDNLASKNASNFIKTGNATISPLIVQSNNKTKYSLSGSYLFHKVREGESLSIIAKLYNGVSAGDIITYNKLPDNNLKIGQILKIPKG